MKISIAAFVLALLIAVPLSAQYQYGFYGTVYEGEGTGNPSGYADVRADGVAKDTTVGCNAQGQYSLRNMPTDAYYEMTAWNEVGEETWWDWKWVYLPPHSYQEENFHLGRGLPPKK